MEVTDWRNLAAQHPADGSGDARRLANADRPLAHPLAETVGLGATATDPRLFLPRDDVSAVGLGSGGN